MFRLPIRCRTGYAAESLAEYVARESNKFLGATAAAVIVPVVYAQENPVDTSRQELPIIPDHFPAVDRRQGSAHFSPNVEPPQVAFAAPSTLSLNTLSTASRPTSRQVVDACAQLTCESSPSGPPIFATGPTSTIPALCAAVPSSPVLATQPLPHVNARSESSAHFTSQRPTSATPILPVLPFGVSTFASTSTIASPPFGRAVATRLLMKEAPNQVRRVGSSRARRRWKPSHEVGVDDFPT